MATSKINMFVKSDSFMHRLDPRTKLIWIPLGFMSVMFFNHPAYVGVILAITIILSLSSKLPSKTYLTIISTSLFIFLASVLIYPLYLKSGPHLFTFIGIDYTLNSLLYAIAIGMRLMTMTSISMLIIMTTSSSNTILGLEQLGLPYKGAVALSMMVRYLPTLIIEGNIIVEAQKCRALDLDHGNPIQRARKYAPIIIPLFTRSFLLAKQLGLALDGRGFGIHNQRTHLVQLNYEMRDKIFLIFWLIILVIAFLGRVTQFGVIMPSLV